MAIIAAEHTAQLNAAQSDEVFSKAEEHELALPGRRPRPSLPGKQPRRRSMSSSCTTTMEVGIDIGTLSRRGAAQYAAVQGELPAASRVEPVAAGTPSRP